MKVQQLDDVEQRPVEMPGACGCKVRSLVGEADGAPNFAMRQFEVAPGGYTPRHSHPYEHEVYVLEGQGVVLEGTRERPLQPGAVVYVAPGDVHQFKNTGSGPLKFLCLVPHSYKNLPATMAPECGCEGSSG
jgi:quercetin dioxygenase-like cupin family protein